MLIVSGKEPHQKCNSRSPDAPKAAGSRQSLLMCVFLLALLPIASLAETLPHSGGPTVPSQSEFLQIEQAVAATLANNPELASLQAQVEAMRTVPSQTGALPDPVLSINAMNVPTDTFDLDQEPMTQIQVGFSQALPFPGKRKLRMEVVDHEVEAIESMLGERRNAKIAEVRVAWWGLMNFDLALQIVGQNKDLMRDFVDIAQTKYRVGSGLQQDVLLAQLELSRLLDRELQLRGRRTGAQATLNALMDRPPDWEISLPAFPPSKSLPDLPAPESLLQQAGATRPLIDVQRDLVEAAQARLNLAERDRYPDFKLGVGYGFRQGEDPIRNTGRSDFASVMLSVTVPLYSGSKQSKAIEQRTHEVSRQNLMLRDTVQTVAASVYRGIADYGAARDQVVLYETAIIPQAQQTVSSMLAGYQVNQVDFLSLINTQITLYNAQISYWQSLARAKQALATLASAIGEEALYE